MSFCLFRNFIATIVVIKSIFANSIAKPSEKKNESSTDSKFRMLLLNSATTKMPSSVVMGGTSPPEITVTIPIGGVTNPGLDLKLPNGSIPDPEVNVKLPIVNPSPNIDLNVPIGTTVNDLNSCLSNSGGLPNLKGLPTLIQDYLGMAVDQIKQVPVLGTILAPVLLTVTSLIVGLLTLVVSLLNILGGLSGGSLNILG